jgi:hypothetical protein
MMPLRENIGVWEDDDRTREKRGKNKRGREF